MKASRHIPLFFPFSEMIMGNGFMAEVKGTARVLAVEDDGGSCWFHGVNPGGISAGDGSFGVAHQAFRLAFRTALFDFAEEATAITEFERSVSAYFNRTSGPFEADWLAAVQSVRAGKVEMEGMRRLNADSTPWTISVTNRSDKTQFKASENVTFDRADIAA